MFVIWGAFAWDGSKVLEQSAGSGGWKAYRASTGVYRRNEFDLSTPSVRSVRVWLG